MAQAANKATRRRLPNLLYVQAAVEQLPADLTDQADRITVNFPWGSLLRAVALPDRRVLSAIARLGHHGATLTLLVNMSVFDDAAYCAKLGLHTPPVFADAACTRDAYEDAGLRVMRCGADAAELPYRTTWGQRLTKGTQRRVLWLESRVEPTR
jgi:16S rRNA (adenine(1408)-N(1))-methyltransferase